MTVRRKFVVRNGLLANDSSQIQGTITIDSDAVVGGFVQLAQGSAPSPTTNRLYNVGGRLYWNGFLLDSDAGGAGGGGITIAVDSAAPVAPDSDALWIDTRDATLNWYYYDSNNDAQWIVLSGPAGPPGADGGASTANDIMSLIQTLDSNGSGLNADTLDGQQGTYYLAYANFTGTPNVLDSAQIQAMTDSNEASYTLDYVTSNGNTTTNSITVEDATINGLISIADSTGAPSVTTNKLYAVGGRLYWNAFLLDSDASGGGGTTETANSILSKLKTIDSDGSGLNADTLDGQQGSYYLAYGNLTGAPNVLDSANVQSIVDSNALSANDIMSLVQTLDSNGSGLNADTLDAQQGTYYLDYNNFTNTPAAVTASSVMSLIQTKDSDTSGLNADTLDGQQGTYYLAYANFTGTPSVLDSGQIQSMIDSNEVSYTLDYVTTNGNTTTNSITVLGVTSDSASIFNDYIQLTPIAAPTVTTNRLYNIGGRLYWNNFILDSDAGGVGGGGGGIDSADANILIGNRKRSKSVSIASPTATEDLTLFYTDSALDMTAITSVVRGTTPRVVFTVRHDSASRAAIGTEIITSGITCTNDSAGDIQTTFNDGSIPAGSWVWLETDSVTGTVDEFHVTLSYT